MAAEDEELQSGVFDADRVKVLLDRLNVERTVFVAWHDPDAADQTKSLRCFVPEGGSIWHAAAALHALSVTLQREAELQDMLREAEGS